MQLVEHAVIAAAGLGSRLGHGLPKCMVEIGGQTLLTRLISSLSKYVNHIHVVVGYREELIINQCANLHRNIVIVRNPEYRTTNTVQSMALGARGLEGKTLFLDGDLIIEPASLRKFIEKAGKHPILVAIADSQSENPVNVDLLDSSCSHDTLMIGAFTREAGRIYEWANVVAGPARMLDSATGYVYERLEKHIPLCAEVINLREIDTVSDLALARQFAALIDIET